MSADPLGRGATPDLYGYANGDPINYVDPDGLNPRRGGIKDDTEEPEDPPAPDPEPSAPESPSDDSSSNDSPSNQDQGQSSEEGLDELEPMITNEAPLDPPERLSPASDEVPWTSPDGRDFIIIMGPLQPFTPDDARTVNLRDEDRGGANPADFYPSPGEQVNDAGPSRNHESDEEDSGEGVGGQNEEEKRVNTGPAGAVAAVAEEALKRYHNRVNNRRGVKVQIRDRSRKTFFGDSYRANTNLEAVQDARRARDAKLRLAKGAGRVLAVAGPLVTVLDVVQNEFSDRSILRAGASFVVLGIGLVNPIGAGLALGYAVLDGFGAFDSFWERFDNSSNLESRENNRRRRRRRR